MTDPKQFNMQQIEKIIKNLSEIDLIHLNKIIVERLNLLSQVKSSVKMSNFHNGQRIFFTTPEGVEKKGHILRLNKKTISILTDEGDRWNVAPDFLRKL